MGKRKKSTKPQGPKKREPLATSFKCVFCNHETSVSVQLDKKNNVGTLNCRQCGQSFQSSSEMARLAQPVDIYFEWIDACEDVAKDQAAATAPAPARSAHGQASASRSRAGLAPGEKVTEEDERFIDDDGVDAEAEYADE